MARARIVAILMTPIGGVILSQVIPNPVRLHRSLLKLFMELSHPIIGDLGRIQTCDFHVRSVALYSLSYETLASMNGFGPSIFSVTRRRIRPVYATYSWRWDSGSNANDFYIHLFSKQRPTPSIGWSHHIADLSLVVCSSLTPLRSTREGEALKQPRSVSSHRLSPVVQPCDLSNYLGTVQKCELRTFTKQGRL